MNLIKYRLFFFILVLGCVANIAKAQYSLPESGLNITFDGVNFGTVDPLAAAPAATQLDSDNWAIDLDDDNDFDMGGDNTGGFGSLFEEGQDFTADNVDWSNFAAAEGFYSYNYNFGGINTDFPAVGLAVSGHEDFRNQDNSLIAKIENTSSLEYTDIELSLDAYYYYRYLAWYNGNTGIPDLFNLSIHYFIGDATSEITTDLSTATWTEISTLSINNETVDGWKQFTGTDLEINGISINTGDFLYLKFTFSPNGEQANPDPALAIDNISITPVGFGGTDATTTLSIQSEATPTLDPSYTSTTINIFSFNIVDNGAGDGFPTTFSELSLTNGTSNTVTDWSTLINSATLSDGTTSLAASPTSSSASITFSGFNYASTGDFGYVDNASTKTYTLTIDFVDTYAGSQNIDNELLQFLVQSSEISIEGVSSTFQTANSIETSSSNNILSVSADRLVLQDEPSVVGTGSTSDVYFGFSVRAEDAAGHLDLDDATGLTITESTQVLNSGGSLTFSTGSASANFSSGVYTFSDLFFSTSGDYTISLTSGASYTGANFTVTAATSWRSVADGDWGNSTGTVWQYFVDGAGWTSAAANEHPNATLADVGPVYIYNTVAIETAGIYNSDQLIIESSGILDVNNSFTINEDGTTSSRDLIIREGGTVDVEAEVTINGTFLVEEGNSLAGGGKITSGTGDYILDFGTSTNGYWESNGVLRYTADAIITITGNTTFFDNAESDQYPLLEITALRFDDLTSGGNTVTVNGIVYYTDPDVADRMHLGSDNYVVRNGLVSATGTLRYDDLTSMTGDTLFFGGDIHGQATEVDLTISSTAPTAVQLLDNVTSSGNDRLNFEVASGGTLLLGDYDADFGDWTFQSGSTIKVSNTAGFGADQFAGADALVINSGTVFHFNGTAAQNTGFGNLNGGITEIASLVIDNAAGTTLDSDVTLSSDLTFENGIFTTQNASPGILTVSSSVNFSGFSTTSHIQGPISIEAFADAKFIPIGANDAGTDFYRPAIVDPASSTTVILEYRRSDPNTDISNVFDTDGTYNPQALTTSGYFNITFGTTGTADIALFFDETNDAIAGSTDLIIAKYDNSAGEWVGYEATGFGADYLLATVNVDDVSDVYFTVASLTPDLLPVDLIAFKVETDGQESQLSWSTASELNNNKFEIEHSANGFTFSKVGEVEGAGTTNQQQFYSYRHSSPVVGINYYRLKQLDFDGAFEYSPIVRVIAEPIVSPLQLLQNPVKDQNLRFLYRANVNPDIWVYDLSGIKYSVEDSNNGSNSYEIDLNFLPKGMYILSVDDQKVHFIMN